jgi:hypothetical protein
MRGAERRSACGRSDKYRCSRSVERRVHLVVARRDHRREQAHERRGFVGRTRESIPAAALLVPQQARDHDAQEIAATGGDEPNHHHFQRAADEIEIR